MFRRLSKYIIIMKSTKVQTLSAVAWWKEGFLGPVDRKGSRFPAWWKEGFLSPVNRKGSLHGGRKGSSVQWTGKVPGGRCSSTSSGDRTSFHYRGPGTFPVHCNVMPIYL